MNYRHSFHAGNFADVVKHTVLARIVEYLKRKEKPFRVIDTHAGVGMYDLAGDQSARTGEWQGGIGRVLDAKLPPAAAGLLEPYLETVRAAREQGATLYPGSPWIVRHLLRKQDRLSAIELHPQDAIALKELFAGDFQVRVTELDGWLTMGAHVPPKEKRGLILVDPPFEREGEFDRLVDGAVKAYGRWPGGLQALWYPIKDRAAVAQFRENMATSGIARVLDLRLTVRKPGSEPRLDGTGMIIVNPPFVLEQEMNLLLPALANLLQQDDGARSDVVWLARPPSDA